MVKHKKLGMAVAGAFALCGASAAHAFNVKAGDWDLSMSGEVNAFYTYTQCQNTTAATIAMNGNTTCATANTHGASSVESGLLPSALVFSAKTTQEGFDIGVTFGFYPGINNGSQFSGAATSAAGLPQPSALGSTGIDMRKNFFTFGDKEMGTIKMGRDLGLFGSDAILSDMTLLGVGTPQVPQNPGNTTLGRIGIGYIYADWIPQITYITPSFSGFQVSAGVFTPLNMLGTTGFTALDHSVPMIQAKATYDFNAMDVKGRVWVGGVEERAMVAGPGADMGATAVAGEVGAKASVAGLDGMVYYYQGRGVGTTGLFLRGVDATGNKRNSNGGIAQLQYSIGKWKPGISYGVSRLAPGNGDKGTVAGATLVNFNRSGVGQLQYSLTKSLTLLGEYAHSWSTAQQTFNGSKLIENSFSVGGILFF